MKVLFLGAQYAYNDPSRGYSYEFEVLFASLAISPGISTAEFLDVYASDEARSTILDEASGFDCVIYAPYTGALSPDVMRRLSKGIPTLVFFLDDTWRSSFVATYAGVVTAFTTSDPFFGYRYNNQVGLPIFVPFGYEPFDQSLSKDWNDREIDVSFIGSRDAFREYVVQLLVKEGITVTCFGPGWDNSHLSRSDFWNVLGDSKLTLNLSNSRNLDLSFLFAKPSAIVRGMRSGKTIEQIKARHIEAAAAGACQLSYYTTGLEEILVPGRELLCYGNLDELPDLVRRCLWDDQTAESVASKGQAKVAGFRYDRVWADILGRACGHFNAA